MTKSCVIVENYINDKQEKELIDYIWKLPEQIKTVEGQRIWNFGYEHVLDGCIFNEATDVPKIVKQYMPDTFNQCTIYEHLSPKIGKKKYTEHNGYSKIAILNLEAKVKLEVFKPNQRDDYVINRRSLLLIDPIIEFPQRVLNMEKVMRHLLIFRVVPQLQIIDEYFHS